jgi:hypothetical protein
MVLIGDGVALASDIFLDHRCADNMSGEVVLKARANEKLQIKG